MTASVAELAAKLSTVEGDAFEELCQQIEALDDACPHCGGKSKAICEWVVRHFKIAVIHTTPAIAKKYRLSKNTAKPGTYWIPKYVYENLGLDLDATFTLANTDMPR